MKANFKSILLFVTTVLLSMVYSQDLFSQKIGFRGDLNNQGVYKSDKIGHPRCIWKFRTGGMILGSATVKTSFIYFGSGDGFIYKVDSKKGTLIWKYATGGPVSSTPIIVNNVVYINSFDGKLYAINSETGTEKWSFKTGGESTRYGKMINGLSVPGKILTDSWDVYQSSPLFIDNNIFFGSGDSCIYSINAETGTLIWKFKTGNIVHSSPTYSEGMIFCGSWDSKVYALDVISGKKIWEFTTGIDNGSHLMEGIQGSPVVSDGLVLFGSRDANIYALDSKTGTLKWKKNFGGSWMPSSITPMGDHIYTGSSDATNFYCLRKSDGKTIFQKSTRSYTFSTPALTDSMAYIGSTSGRLHAININTGVIVWEFRTDGSYRDPYKFFNDKGVVNSKATADLFKNKNTNDIDDKEWMKRMYSSGSIFSSPVVDNKIVYFGSSDSCMYAVGDYNDMFIQPSTGFFEQDKKVGTYGTNWIDYNSDGFLDLFVCNYGGKSLLYKNLDGKSFEKIDAGSLTNEVHNASGSCWADYDNDGDLDVFVANQGEENNTFYRNEGNGKFTRITEGDFVNNKGDSYHSAWIDYDNDGWLDLYVANNTSYSTNKGQKNFLYHNNGDGTLTKITDGVVVNDQSDNTSGNWADYDNDGDMDLFVVGWNGKNTLLRNEGGGQFAEVTNGEMASDFGVSIASAWGDYNNDGKLDLYISNGWPTKQKNYLYKNAGNGSFTKIIDGPMVNDLVNGWNTAWGDLDNDGDLDLYSNDYTGKECFYENNGNGIFTKIFIDKLTGISRTSAGISFVDFNNDGNLDIFMGVDGGENLMFVSQGNGNNWLTMKCKGIISNKSGIGTKVKMKASIFGQSVWQMREMASVTGIRRQVGWEHFGLGDAKIIDTLIVTWPSGVVNQYVNIPVNQILTLTEEMTPDFLMANFTADKIFGIKELKVQFKDLSVADTKNPIISWKWDFNNDGKPDSDEKNPSWTFKTDKQNILYSVTMTIATSSKSSTLIRKNYITIATGTPSLEIDAKTIDFGDVDRAINQRDTIISIKNTGDGIDTVSIWQPYSGAEQLKFSFIEPSKFALLPGETKQVKIGFKPGEIDTLKAGFSGKIKICSMFGNSATAFYKNFKFKLVSKKIITTGQLLENKINNQVYYPNPFKKSIFIKYTVLEPSIVKLTLYNITGQLVKEIVNQKQQPGMYQVCWNGEDNNGKLTINGIYFSMLLVGQKVYLEKILKM